MEPNKMKIEFATPENGLFLEAEKFVLPNEKKCCGLMQRILEKDKSIFLFRDNSNELLAVISYNIRTRIVFHCIPQTNKQLSTMFSKFFEKNHVYCISGELYGTDFLQGIIAGLPLDRIDEVRDYNFMEFQSDDEPIEKTIGSHVIKKCGVDDADKLFEMHKDYVNIEVLPLSATINLASERLNLENILRTQTVFAIDNGKEYISKAHTNARGKNVVQIGGVFTKEQYRGKRYAGYLVRFIGKLYATVGIKTVLFVKKTNRAAISSYSKAGFVLTGQYRITYFLANSTDLP